MSNLSARPPVADLEVPIDTWTQPFWDGTAAGKLLAPRCTDCSRFRWPPGPFCPHCHSQRVDWVPAGKGRIYSFTIVPSTTGPADEARPLVAPGLIEFPDAGGIRLLGAIVDAPLSAIRIGAAVELDWAQARNAKVPIFRLAGA